LLHLHTGLYVGRGGHVYKVDPTDGTVLAVNGLEGYGPYEVSLGTTLSKDTILAGINGTSLALDPSDLVERWRTTLFGSGSHVTTVLGGHGYSYSSYNGSIYKLRSTDGHI
jgi:hypothetical protein